LPKRTDIKKILVIGSGPIIIGQACEFDYSGTQACRALESEGYEVVLLNSNPATIMTDPDTASRIYIEPITLEVLEKIIAREQPDALLPTLGGQTALNLAVSAYEAGMLEKYNVEMIGANYAAIHRAEDREEFKQAMKRAGAEVPQGRAVYTVEEAVEFAEEIGLPMAIRPAFTMGGSGGGFAFNMDEFREAVRVGLDASPITEVLVEESVLGWKEYELEVMRDRADNAVIICSIENLDAMGIHTGDSITVAPIQTLSDREYQAMRDEAIAIIREIGVETGGSNIQFAVDPATGRRVAIEMNPRVSRSSALASKATGFPIAKFAAKLAVGYTLDEIPNDITRKTPASFEPSIDYCVVKVPRFTFEKFAAAEPLLGISMKSVGETMGIGRTFREALGKSLRGLETGLGGLDEKGEASLGKPGTDMAPVLAQQRPERVFAIKRALKEGMSPERIYELSCIDPWFIDQIQRVIETEAKVRSCGTLAGLSPELLKAAKRDGFSDAQVGALLGAGEDEVYAVRTRTALLPAFKLVDTCAAEFEACTPYYYSTFEQEDESRAGT
jgi:carbamoyl-phosphate synthase large subunit